MVEGYTDVIALHEAGIATAVATLGTALTARHVRLLARFAKRVVYLFDGDEAGQRAADRAAGVPGPAGHAGGVRGQGRLPRGGHPRIGRIRPTTWAPHGADALRALVDDAPAPAALPPGPAPCRGRRDDARGPRAWPFARRRECSRASRAPSWRTTTSSTSPAGSSWTTSTVEAAIRGTAARVRSRSPGTRDEPSVRDAPARGHASGHARRSSSSRCSASRRGTHRRGPRHGSCLQRASSSDPRACGAARGIVDSGDGDGGGARLRDRGEGAGLGLGALRGAAWTSRRRAGRIALRRTRRTSCGR